ncbi:hypothetical protein B0H16DRAFT_1457148 [Mycena metata]|uniref:Uncharacterized protein n=1 Tax=Mycena metata TaxID=1033252 RepID=A0AAD7NFZ0_9AGAR|nr:hypothetical protein B0H16DRAFT_1457148 [Mycena metata]
MDQFYDKQGAAIALDKEARERRALAAENYNPVFQHLADLELCIPCEEDGYLDEVVFAVQGILTNVSLVPVTGEKLEARRAIRLGQRAEISGLNSQTFEDAIAKLEASHDKFQQFFGGQSIQRLVMQNGHFGRALATSNRIFTMRSDYPHEQSTSFEQGVDPLGVLERMSTREIFHGPDNVVKYYRKLSDRSDGWFPGAFKIGDIVELQASLVVVQTANGGIKMTCRLHALTLLDDSYTKEAAIRRAASKKAPTATTAVRKRIEHPGDVWKKTKKKDAADQEREKERAASLPAR